MLFASNLFSLAAQEKADQAPANSADWKTLALLFLFALGLRLYRLFELDVWFDEVGILFETQASFGGVWALCRMENFPPLYLWLLKIWRLASATDDWSRLFSAFTGALIPPVAYLLGKELHGRRLGLLMGMACVFSLPLYYYSQVIRMYSHFILFSCLSYYGFLRALRTQEWKYWWLTAISNLLGFYTFLFMSFVILAEALVLLWQYRLEMKKYVRPVLSHLPAFILISFWALALLNRYAAVQSYLSKHLELQDFIGLWIYFGTGYKVPHQPVLMILLNLPFPLGLILGVRYWVKERSLFFAALILTISMIMISASALVGPALLYDRYLLFLLPLYFALVFFGWMRVQRRLWRALGVAWVFGALIFSQIYYQNHHMQVNDTYRYQGAFTTPEDDDGRSFSRMAALLKNRLQKDEVIIHYSDHFLRSFSFFPFVYYHARSLPEHFYSAQELPQYSGGGQQYLRPGDWIRTLRDLQAPPAGIWVVTLNNPDFVLFNSPLYQAIKRTKKSWIDEADFAKELFETGYRHLETIRDGAVSVVHFRRTEPS